METHSIALIILYFGKWPAWSNFFLKSCTTNSDIKFLIFTDNAPHLKSSKNIQFIDFNVNNFNELASHKLGLSLDVKQPYKICDFRPAFGLIFEDYFQGFSFWGHIDIDIIFGSISRFITKEILNYYDIITARKEYIVGHFTLFRNCARINQLFKESQSYQTIFQSPDYMGFDECGFSWWPLLKGKEINTLSIKNDNITQLVKRLVANNAIKALFAPLVLEQDKIERNGYIVEFDRLLTWENGHLMDVKDNQNFLYFHFHFLKKSKLFYVPDLLIIPNKYYI